MARINRYLSLSNELERYLYQNQRGNRLPSEEELARRFEASKPTLRKALKILKQKGLIQTENGIGNTVLNHPATISKELIFFCSDLVFFADTLKEFSIESANNGYISSIISLPPDSIMRERIFKTALQKKPAGIILYAGAEKKIDLPIPQNIPILHLVRRYSELRGDLLSFQNREAETAIVRKLYAEGCRRFALYGMEKINPDAAEERKKGFLTGMKMVRLRPRNNSILLPSATEEQIEAFFQLFTDPKNCPDAVCCLNDHCAGDFLLEMNRRKLSVETLRISGFDANGFTLFFPKRILTVKPPMEMLGKRAVELLIRRIENTGLAEINEILKSELVTI